MRFAGNNGGAYVVIVGAAELRSDLVVANRTLAREGVLDAFGHVSFRDPSDSGCFVVSRSLSPIDVSEADLQTLTLERTRVAGDDRSSYAEVAIHAEIYRARPDVLAICHSHAPSTIPFGVTGVPLRPIFHMASVIGDRIPLWDIRSEFGETDMLVRTSEQGASLARALGSASVALMAGHGAVVVGRRLSDVTMTSYYLEQNAYLQLQAMPLGKVRYLSPKEVSAARAMLLDPLANERAWAHWRRRDAEFFRTDS